MMDADQPTGVTRRSAMTVAGAAFALPVVPFDPISLENRRMAFTPKFIDLVRNYSTTVGTGDLVLGPAVNGFTSFTSALQTGDSFYYAAIGVDKPAEREVGRGTLLAGGAIARDPISGTKTNFTGGTKSVALIAAAEWYSNTQALAGSGGTAGALAAANNLSDLSDASAARANLGLSGIHNVKWFGAKGDTVLSAVPNGPGTAAIVSGTDDTAAIQAAIDHVDSIGGGTLFFPEGRYKVSTYLTCRKKVTLLGAGRMASFIVAAMDGGGGANAGEDLRNGSVLYSGWPSNSATNVHIRVQSLGIHCPSNTNRGAAFYDNCGIGIWLDDCFLSGFKYGVVFDQTEIGHLNNCFLWRQISGGAGFYIVNGPNLTPGNSTTFTNQISVSRCQINEPQTTYGILDEGGYTHSFVDNNYNGCLNHIYLAGSQRFKIDGGEFEASGAANIQLDYRRVADASAVGACTGQIVNAFLSNDTNANVNIASSSGPISVRNCQLSRSDGGAPITGANNCGKLEVASNYVSSTSQEIVDNSNTFLTDNRIPLNVRSNVSQAAIDLTYSYANCFLRCTNVSGNQLTIQPDSAGGTAVMPIGTIVHAEQSTAAGTVSFVAGAGVTVTGPTATNAQYQCIEARKMAANSWQTRLIGTRPLDGANCLSDLPDKAAAQANLGLTAVTQQAGTAYAAALSDAFGYIQFTSGSAVTFTIPPNASVAFPVGAMIQIEQNGAGALSVAAGPGVTINSRGGDLTLAGQYAVAALKKVATDTWTLTGDL